MKTQAEIVARLEARRAEDPFAFETREYLQCLDFAHAKPYLKDDVTEESYAESGGGIETNEKLMEIMKDYMGFAWEKANGCRGLSADRSLAHYVAWTWLIGDDELSWDIDGDCEYYGKENLRLICENYGWNADEWDDGVRINSESEL